jgi:hypothetical protein
LLRGDLNPTKSVTTRGLSGTRRFYFREPAGDSVGAERTVVAGCIEGDDAVEVDSWPPQPDSRLAPRPRRMRPARSFMAVTISPQ